MTHFLCDLDNHNLNISEDADVNVAYDNFNKCFNGIANKHAPCKERKLLSEQVPHIIFFFKSVIYRKKMLFFKQVTSSKYWEAHRKQRNIVTTLKNKSVNKYFIERCVGGPKPKIMEYPAKLGQKFVFI